MNMLGRLVLASLRRHPGATAWNLATLSVLALLVTLFATVGLEVAESMAGTLRGVGANAVAFPAGSGPDWAAAASLATSEGARTARLALSPGTVEGGPVGLVEADPRELASMTPYWDVEGVRPGRPGECLVGRKLARRLEVARGSEVAFRPAGQTEPIRLVVTGVLTSGDEDDERIFTIGPLAIEAAPGAGEVRWPRLPLAHVEVEGLAPGSRTDCRTCHEPATEPHRLTEAALAAKGRPVAIEGARTYMLLSVEGGMEGIERLDDRFAAAGLGIEVRPLRMIVGGEASVLEKAQLLTGWTLVAVVVLVGLGVTAAAFARIGERRKEIALLVALGAHRRSILGVLLAENAGLGGAAGLVGFLLGTLVADAVVRRIFHVAASPQALALVAALAATTAVSLLAGGLAARRALRFRPAFLLRGQG